MEVVSQAPAMSPGYCIFLWACATTMGRIERDFLVGRLLFWGSRRHSGIK